MMERFKIRLYIGLNSRCNGTKKLLKWLAMSFGFVRYSSLLSRIIFRDSDFLVVKKIIDFIPFHVFLILLMFFLK